MWEVAAAQLPQLLGSKVSAAAAADFQFTMIHMLSKYLVMYIQYILLSTLRLLVDSMQKIVFSTGTDYYGKLTDFFRTGRFFQMFPAYK